MRRRAYLTTFSASLLVAAGCTSLRDQETAESTPSDGRDTPASPIATATRSPETRTSVGIQATFEVVDGHAPVEDTAQASFETERVIVTGTMDPGGCRRPVLASVAYDTDTTVRLVVGSESPYGATATVECGNASFDYRSVLSVQRDPPTTLEVVHEYQHKKDRTFSLEYP